MTVKEIPINKGNYSMDTPEREARFHRYLSEGWEDGYRTYRQKTGVTGLGIDWTVPLAAAKDLQRSGAVQGNLDPLRLVAGGKALSDGVEAILKALGDGPLIFNLGHGITPETPIAHVEAMVKQVRSATR